ncbi:MAG TPA: glycosyltransferase family 4 protein [Candidatus Limnocylindrales bacterium]|nr:glycosyltransferase family 4 protein [Candidatus Limnocylindrales bacterium]
MTPPEPLRLAFIGNPTSVHLQRWVNFFADRGHRVWVLDGFGSPPTTGLHPAVELVRYDAWGSVRLPGIPVLHARRELRRVLRALKPDVIHAHSVKRYGWQAALAGFHPYVISTWGSDVLLRGESWRSRFWHRRALSRADLVTAVSSHMSDAAVAAGAKPDHVVEIQFGVDTRRFTPADVPASTLERLGIHPAPFVLSPRGMRPLYNHETITAAFAMLGTPHQLVMTGRNADAEYLQPLLAELARQGAAERVRVIDDVSDDDMLALYQAAGVVVSAPISDSFPITLLEAMACGTPIVAGDLPPVRAVLDDLVPDALVPTFDAGEMATAMRRALELSPDARHRLATALRERVVATADYETNMLQMEELYRGLARRT